MLFNRLLTRLSLANGRRKPAKRLFEILDNRLVLSSAPVIDLLSAAVTADDTISISGHVSDFDPGAGALQISLSGPVAARISPDAWGNFSYDAPASGLGVEQAAATDAGTGLTSASVQTPVVDNAPQIMFSVQETGDGQNVIVSGSVMDEAPAGLTVDFSGVVSGSTITDASGNFAWYTTASALGTVTATCSDWWGVAANPVDSVLADPGPSLIATTIQPDSDGEFTISGQIVGGVVGGAIVQASGAVSGTAVADASGNFSLKAPSSGTGTVSLTATNVWQQTSAPVALSVPDAPALSSLAVTCVADPAMPGMELVTITGHVSGLGPFTLTMSGLINDTAFIEDGDFSFFYELPAGVAGSVSVVATNASGVASPPESADISPP